LLNVYQFAKIAEHLLVLDSLSRARTEIIECLLASYSHFVKPTSLFQMFTKVYLPSRVSAELK